MSENGNSQAPKVDFSDPVYKSRMKKATELVAGLGVLNQMIEGAMKGDHASRLQTDPDSVAKDILEFVDFMGRELSSHDVAPDWRATFKAEPVPATDLLSLIDAPIPYIVKPLIVEGSLTQIQGVPKGGKSAFAVYLALLLATGTWPTPQYFRGGDDPVDVLYLAWEDPKIMMAKRLSLYAVGLGHGRTFLPPRLKFLFAPDLFVEQADHEAALRAAIAELKPKVIFIDTLSHVHRCDENSSSEMKLPMKALAHVAQDIGIGIVYIHHTGKGSGEKLTHEKSRGSGAIAAAWHVLIDWGVREKGSNVNPVEIQSKYESSWRNLEISYLVDKDDFGNESGIRWAVNDEDTSSRHAPATGDKNRERILSILKAKPGGKDWLSWADILPLLKPAADQKTIRRHLQALESEGLVESKFTGPKTPFLYKFTPSEGNLS